MYKTRLAKWGLYKNNRELEMKAIFSKLTECVAAGKECSFELRGHKVDLRDCERYFKRKCFNIRDVISWKAAHTTTPSGLRCFTPEPQERLLADVRTYFLGCFENGIWVPTSIEYMCYSQSHYLKVLPLTSPPEKSMWNCTEQALKLFNAANFGPCSASPLKR